MTETPVNPDQDLLTFLSDIVDNVGVHPMYRVQAASVLMIYHKKFGASWDNKDIREKLRPIALNADFADFAEPDDHVLSARLDAALLVLR